MSNIKEGENWVDRMLSIINCSFSQEDLIEILQSPTLPTTMNDKIYLILLTKKKSYS